MIIWRHGLDGPTFWSSIFGNDAAVEVEIGSGDGVFLESWASHHPERNFLGLERSPSKARRLAQRFTRRPLRNVRTLLGDARCLVASVIPAHSVTAYHVYFPDPWPKRGHAPRRLFSADLTAALARTLVVGGRFWFATDVASYAAIARGYMLGHGAFREVLAPDRHPGLTTSFARKYRAEGRSLQAFLFERAVDVDEAQRLAASNTRSM